MPTDTPPDQEGTATIAVRDRLLDAGHAERIATDVRLAIADLMLQPKEDRAPLAVVLADAVLPHLSQLRAAAKHEALQEYAARTVPLIDAVIDEAAKVANTGVQITAARGHLHWIANDVIHGKTPEGLK